MGGRHRRDWADSQFMSEVPICVGLKPDVEGKSA